MPSNGAKGSNSGSDIDAIAGNVVAIIDDVAEIDADAQMKPFGFILVGLLSEDRSLNCDAAPERGSRAGELRKKPVAGGLDDATAEFSDFWIDHLLSQHANSSECSDFVALHQGAVTSNVGDHNGG